MDLPVGQQTRRFLASIIATYISVLIAIYFAVSSGTVSGRSGLLLALIGLLAAGGAERILTYGPLIQYRENQLSTFFGDYLRLVENDIEDLAANDVEVRANIMRPSKDRFFDDPTYEISFWHDRNDYACGEFGLEFEIGEGCVGKTHDREEQTFAISPDHVRSWGDAWETTSIHDQVAGHLNTIIGTPIYRPNDEERTTPVAVLIIDSQNDFSEFVDLGPGETLEDIDFKETEVSERSTEHARNTGILL